MSADGAVDGDDPPSEETDGAPETDAAEGAGDRRHEPVPSARLTGRKPTSLVLWLRAISGRRRAVAVAAVVVLLGGVWWATGRGHRPERTVGQTVSGFFLAQRDGDCERLTDLVSERSWSQSGRLSREEFLDDCAEALDTYEPTARTIGVDIGPEGDRAFVDGATAAPYGIELDYDGRRTEGPDPGSLVREDGEWKVRTGEVLLVIGRSPEETVAGFADAYNAGDCEELIDHLSEAAWSKDGELSRREFLDRCTETMASVHGGSHQQVPLELGAGEVSIDGDQATAAVGFAGEALSMVGAPSADTVVFVKEGLEWKLEGDRDDDPADRADPTAPFHAVRWARLDSVLLDELVLPDATCVDYSNFGDSSPAAESAGRFLDHAPGQRAIRSFNSCYVGVGLYQFEDEDAARAGVELWKGEILDVPLPTSQDLDETEAEVGFSGRDRSLAEWDDYVGRLRPNHEAPIPGATGVLTDCDVDGCGGAVALGVHGSLVVMVEAQVGDLADVTTALQQQLGRL